MKQKNFLSYYLKNPVGPQVLTLGENEKINEAKLLAFRLTFKAWIDLNGPKNKLGKLTHSMDCINLISKSSRTQYQIAKCNNRTTNPTGLCRYHDKPDALTLFNDGVLEYLKIVQDNVEYYTPEAVQARLDAERDQREEKWRDIASRIHHAATDRQIYFLLDLGAKPEQLEGITKRMASAMIDDILDRQAK